MNDAPQLNAGRSSGAASPLARYRAEVASGMLAPDAAQAAAAAEVERLFVALESARGPHPPPGGTGLGATLRAWFAAGSASVDTDAPGVAGLYLWGGVGRGKTHLMDLLFGALTVPERRRIHFHEFMQGVHDELKTLRSQRDPLQAVAERISRGARVLCFDEFHVADITDAMLLGRLLAGLFERGTVLVATSNTAPDDLYRGGLQRERFLPAIELIKRHTRVFNLGGDTDYRLRALERAEIYHCPLDEEAERSLGRAFERLSPHGGEPDAYLHIGGRPIRTRRCCEGVAWFDFAVLCGGPRSTADYMAIARRFNTVLLGGIPVMDEQSNDAALRFVHLVDEFYDRNVKLVVSAAAPPDGLYVGQRVADRFQRTRSRLEEMRSHQYLSRPHLP